MSRSCLVVCLVLLTPLIALADPAKAPLDLALRPDGRLVVALRDGKALVVVAPGSWRVEVERPLPICPLSLAVVGDGSTSLVGDTDGECLVVGDDSRMLRHLVLGRGPTQVLSLACGLAILASQWDDSARLVDWNEGWTRISHPLPFPPGVMVQTLGGRVIVADAFQGNLLEFEPALAGSARLLKLDGVNLYMLAISGDGRELLIGHMTKAGASPINRTNIGWGLIYSSKLSALRLTEFGVTGRTLNVRRLTLDGSGHGAADSSALAVCPDGTKLLLALAGAGQVLWIDRNLGAKASAGLLPPGDSQKLNDIEVGRSPVALSLDPSGGFAVTADSMPDILTVFQVNRFATVATAAINSSPIERTARQRGEAAFHDVRSALERWTSCSSCHAGGYTSGLTFDANGDDGYGAAKNTPTLLGCGPSAPYSWTGRFATLEAQIAESLNTSLRGPGTQPDRVDDLVAFLHSLEPAPGRRSSGDPVVLRGKGVFQIRGCDACHVPPTYTSPVRRDVGLTDDPGGNRRLNPPSLRGVSRSAPYLHDGRDQTLDDALQIHHPGIEDTPWDQSQTDDLAAFLESL